MIAILSVNMKKSRTFGWVQDACNLRSLCDVVAVFDYNSEKHKILKKHVIPELIEERDGRNEFIEVLNCRPLKISYSQLIGTSFTPRSISRCNGIIQAAVKGQVRDFIGDWPADNYVRWAHCLGFIKYNYGDDTFEITDKGLLLAKAGNKNDEELSENEKEILTEAILSYSPAIRILKLLSVKENVHLTKFEIGKQLGFVGEDGFTNMPQKLFIQSLCEAKSLNERNSIKSDWEGSSDKYARTILSWLGKLGLTKKVSKTVSFKIAGNTYTDSINQSYMITAAGLTALRKAEGKSRHKRVAKNICWEMLATKGADRDYVRTRRAYVLKCLLETKDYITVDKIVEYLSQNSFEENKCTIEDDIKGFENIGIDIIRKNDGCYKCSDLIKDFIIPLPKEMEKSDLLVMKEELRSKIKFLSHDYLALVDLAYDSKQNRLFELKTIELLTDECGFQGMHLGGSRKPDGIIYTDKLDENYGVIIDTKAYSKGYNLPISQADEMERYISENQTRDEKINPNKWWENFNNDIEKFYYMFVSGHFKGNFVSQIERISRIRKIDGTAVSVSNLLMCVEYYKRNLITHLKMEEIVFNNSEFIFKYK